MLYRIKKKELTKKLVLFQIKQKQKSIFNLFKKNKECPHKLYKKCTFKRFKTSCEYSKQQIILKNNMFNNMFCKFLYGKCGIISIKHYLLNRKIQKEQNKINYNKIKLFNYKQNYKIFINRIKNRIKLKKILFKYKSYIIKQNYIIFFKQVAISMQKRALLKQKIGNMRQIYLINLIKRAIKNWKKYTKYKNELNAKLLRRKIIGKIFINNLKNNLYEQRTIGMNYHVILLRKYYFHRLRRTVHYIINYRIAKLKFISKYIFLWKEISNKLRVNKYNGLVILSQIYPKLQISYFYKMKKLFFFKFKKRNIFLLQNEINNTKIHNFQNYITMKKKKNIFSEIKYNYIINKTRKKHILLAKKKVFTLIKLNKNKGMSKELKEYEADKLYIKHMKKVIKKCLNNWRYLSNETTIKVNEMRNRIYKKKILNFLRAFRFKNKKRDLKISIKFRTYFLYYYFFQMLKHHTKIMKREKRIINGVQRLINENELDYKYWAFQSLYNNMLVEKFIKEKNLRLKTKIFYALKMICG